MTESNIYRVELTLRAHVMATSRAEADAIARTRIVALAAATPHDEIDVEAVPIFDLSEVDVHHADDVPVGCDRTLLEMLER